MTAAVKVPHVHAEAIKAWADGAAIQYRNISGSTWFDIGGDGPAWNLNWEYRVKPEKVYPVTQMNDGAVCSAYYSGGSVKGNKEELAAFYRIANAALRHAIDANQIIAALDHNNALAALDHSLHTARHVRDMAIARAVEDVYCTLVPNKQRNSDGYLADIIAKASPC
jgi:hypothetical protein